MTFRMRKPKRRYEKRIERAVCRRADVLGVDHIKLNLFGRRSYPDRQFFIPGGAPLLLEFKEKDYEPTALQQRTHKRLRAASYDVQVVDDVDAGIAILELRVKQAQIMRRAVEGARKR